MRGGETRKIASRRKHRGDLVWLVASPEGAGSLRYRSGDLDTNSYSTGAYGSPARRGGQYRNALPDHLVDLSAVGPRLREEVLKYGERL